MKTTVKTFWLIVISIVFLIVAFRYWNDHHLRVPAALAGQSVQMSPAQIEAAVQCQFIAIAAIFVIVTTFLFLCFFTNILRDPERPPESRNSSVPPPIQVERAYQAGRQSNPQEVMTAFSLARTQLAIWITVIACVYIYAVLWDRLYIIKINDTALLLMGISAGTFAVGAILDTVEIQQGINRHQDRQVSAGFFRDILSDSNGISIHRFQNVVWTVVAIICYFYRYNNPPASATGGLPELDSTLLALTGISSATYLTLKTRENVSISKLLPLKIKLALPADTGFAALKLVAPDKVVINITDPSGQVTHAMYIPSATEPPYTFITSLEPEQFLKIAVSWETSEGEKKGFIGSYEGIIPVSDNMMVLVMQLQKMA